MRIGLIGTGNMGSAIIKGYFATHQGEAWDWFVYDKDEKKLEALSKELGVKPCQSIGELVESCNIIIISVKPNNFETVLPEINSSYRSEKILVSIAAGISMSYIESFIEAENPKIVRVMPNTPAMVNKGMTGIAKNKNLTSTEFEPVVGVFRSIGKAEIIEEALMDAVTGVSGSSPAYTYMFIEALAAGAEANGMNKEQALIFAAQSVLGAAEMVLKTGIDPVTLRENVCSPGGTTIEAVKTLQNNGFHENVIEALNAAVEKSKFITR
ncbi:MAG: pyrroline-5-carboxylate reductase [Anaerovoracaceae bacterium]|jgi:pyrroline-5-carboxylate reductase